MARRKPPGRVSGAGRRRNQSYGRRWREIRLKVLERDGYRCQIRAPKCTARAEVVDHITPARVTGPTFNPAALRASCRSCNNWVAAHPEWRPGPPDGLGFPRPSLASGCPHYTPDGSVCVGHPSHWSRWWGGEPEAEAS
jgi:hypothetical protein